MEQTGTNGTGETQARNTKSRAWCLTFNNYTDQNIAEIKHVLEDCVDYVIGKEVGTNGTPHLQGVFKWTNPRSFAAVKKLIPRAHVEPCKNWNASVTYCKKEGDYFAKNMVETMEDQYNTYMHSVYDDVKWHDWQEEIIRLLETKPHDRKVHWFYEDTGGKGKSFVVKFLEWKYDCIICNGKSDNVFNGIKSYIDEKKKYPKIIIMDVPRCMQNYLCYQAIEKIKDGLFYSGKYEGGTVRLLPLHLIIFSNEEPDYNKLSADRWDVRPI